jgi:predicted lactoylglutathione lyase
VAQRQLFVNLPVQDLERSKAFFARLGFEFNPRFTDANAACMVVSDLGFVMLLQERFFRTFTRREPCGARHTEALVAFSCRSRAAVDTVVGAALDAGGAPAMDPVDHGFMYGRSFHDLDGHQWEAFWMDPRRALGEPAASELSGLRRP